MFVQVPQKLKTSRGQVFLPARLEATRSALILKPVTDSVGWLYVETKSLEINNFSSFISDQALFLWSASAFLCFDIKLNSFSS